MHTDKNADDQLKQIKQASLTEGFTTNIGFSNPNSPLDLADRDPLPESGDVGALDPAAGEDIAGDEQDGALELAPEDMAYWSESRQRSGEAEPRLGQSRRISPKPDDEDENLSGGGSSTW